MSEPDESEADASELLRKSYCPPLDDAVFYALASDYQGSELVDHLDQLKAAAVEEENTGFDPSGTGFAAQQDLDSPDLSLTSPGETSTSNGCLTSLASDLGDLRLQEDGTDINQLEAEDQVKFLHGLFPSLSLDGIRIVCGAVSSPDEAIEELLNLSFLADQGDVLGNHPDVIPQGIEWFAEEYRTPRGKGRRRRRKLGRANSALEGRSASSSTPAATSPPPPPPAAAAAAAASNVWEAVNKDIDFICSKTTLRPQAVRSAYHARGANLPLTIRTFADIEGANWNQTGKADAIMQQQIAEIKPLFPTVADAQIFALLKLTRYHPSAVEELLTAMTAPGQKEPDLSRDLAKTMLRYPPALSLASSENSPGPVHHRRHHPLTPSSTSSLSPSPTRPAPAENEWTAVQGKPVRYKPASRGDGGDGIGQVFQQAAAAYKKSKSKPLYAGAAAYYSELGHERVRRSKEASTEDADMLVDSQSTATVLDLHRVDVANAVRIALQKTQTWWDQRGDTATTRYGEFRIITGLGTHSKNRRGQIGPALAKRLVNEGWKIEILHGEILVLGRRRRT